MLEEDVLACLQLGLIHNLAEASPKVVKEVEEKLSKHCVSNCGLESWLQILSNKALDKLISLTQNCDKLHSPEPLGAL